MRVEKPKGGKSNNKARVRYAFKGEAEHGRTGKAGCVGIDCGQLSTKGACWDVGWPPKIV